MFEPRKPVVTSCRSINRLEADHNIDPGKDSVVVLGLAPANHRLQLFAGDVKNGIWHEHLLGIASFYGAADRGYVVAKVGSNVSLAVPLIVVVTDSTKILGRNYTPCGKTRTVVFRVAPGKVVYLSDFEFEEVGTELRLKYAGDLVKARGFIDANYPALKGRLEQGDFELMPTSFACGPQTIYIPIFIPR